MKFQDLVFGIPKEVLAGEKRVAAIPETVRKMIANDAYVLIEKNAGEGSNFTDDEYRAAGAEIVDDVEKVFERADILLKVKEPHFNESVKKHEVDMMHNCQYLIAFLHPAFPGNHKMVRSLAEKGVISFTLDSIPRISRAQFMDALTSMSTVAGYKGMLMAANRLLKFIPMTGTAAGMIKPAQVLIIGAGVAGLQAVATAKRLGAVVYATDIRSEACEQASSIGANIVDLNIPQKLTAGEGGYAKKLPDEWLIKERETLKEPVSQADIVILSALIPGRLAPVLVTEEMVKLMRPSSVVVDIAIDQGGNCELTEAGKIVEKHKVSIIGIQNIPGTVPISSTWMFANNIYNFIDNLIYDGTVKINMEDEIIAKCLLTDEGNIVHAGAREAMNL